MSNGNNTEKNPTFGVLFLAIFIDLLGFGIIIPLLPFMVNLFNADDFGGEGIAYAWILAVYSIAQFTVAPFWGRLSDRIGRRPVILIGLLGSSISFGYFAFTESFYSILFSRILAGFFTAASLPAARAYIADITPIKNRAKKFGLLGAAFGLGFTFGPVIGGLLANISIANLATHAAPGFFAAGLSLVNFLLAYRNLPESLTDEIKLTNQGIESKSQFNVLQEAFSMEGIAILIIIFAATTFIFSGFEAIFSLFLIFLDSDLDEMDIGLIFAMLGIIVIIVQVKVIGPMVERFGEEYTLLTGLVFLSIGFLASSFIHSVGYLVIAVIPMAIGTGMVNPSVAGSISKRTPREQQGGIMGLNSSSSALGRIFGPLTAGFLYDQDKQYPFLFGFFTMVLTLLFGSLFLKPVKHENSAEKLPQG